MNPTVLVTGGTGFIGSSLTAGLLKEGYSVVIPTRSGPSSDHPSKHFVPWDALGPKRLPDVSGFEAVVNLAGENIASGRWTEARKRRLSDSRIRATQACLEALRRASPRPKVFVSASAVGYYGPAEGEALREEAPNGSDFLAGLCRQWEEEASKSEPLGVRTVRLRIGVVLGKGGALAKMLTPFKLGLGGPLGSGEQWMSWIHLEDVAGIVLHLLKAPEASGPVNATAPEPATNRDFSKTLARALGRPCLPFSVPAFALKILVGEMAQMLLTGQRVLPAKAEALGYRFRHPSLEGCLRSLVG